MPQYIIWQAAIYLLPCHSSLPCDNARPLSATATAMPRLLNRLTQQLARLPLKREHWQFAIGGVFGLVADVGSLYLLLALGCNYYSGRLLSFLFAVFTTWQFNRQFTFRQQAQVADWGELARQFWQYLVAMLFGGIVNFGCYSLIVWQLPRHAIVPMLAVAVGSLVGMVFNFCAAKWLVFKK